jgi:hypothetical protein
MPRAGIEPARGYPRGILSPLRLPIPPPRQQIFSIGYAVFVGSLLGDTISFTITSCFFIFFLMLYWMNYANLEGLLDKNTWGIMSYQLRIFQLILVVFSTGCASGMKED